MTHNEPGINDCFTDDTEPDYFGFTDPAFGSGDDLDPATQDTTFSFVDPFEQLDPNREYDTVDQIVMWAKFNQ